MAADQVSSSNGRCPSSRKWQRLLFISAAFIGLFVSFYTWQTRSPKGSFLVLKLSIAANFESVTQALIDIDRLHQNLLSQLTPLLIPTETQIDLGDEAALANQQLLTQTLKATLPIIMNSLKRTNVTGMNEATHKFIPLLFGISPNKWSAWLEEISAGHVQMNDCHVKGKRAACEIVIEGPENESATIATLWELSPSYIWRLQGIAGLDRLVDSIREQN